MRLRLLLLALLVLVPFTATSAADPPGLISTKPPSVAASTTATFEFSSSQPADAFTCSRDGSDPETCTSPKTYNDLTDGNHTFVVHALKDGTEIASDTYGWKVDSAPPTISAHPSSASNTTSANFSFSGPDASFVNYQCALDENALAACTSPQQYTGLTEGAHSFQVEADAGGVGKPARYDWIVDTTPPQTTISAMPASPSHGSATFAFSSNESGVTFTCALDGVEAACTSPTTYDGLADGQHTFQVRATDAATNVGAPASYSWVVDSVPPDLRFSEAPPALTRSDTATFAFASGESAGFQCALDDAPLEACASPMVYDQLADGPHTFTVDAIDAAANVGGPLVYTWTVDTTPPANVSHVHTHVGYSRATVVWTLSSSVDFDHLTLFDAAGKKLVAIYTGDATSYTRLRVDHLRTYRYEIVSYDHAGNASGAATITIAPTALLQAPRPNAAVGDSPAFAWTPVRKARFYNVQLFHGGTKILTTWPRSPRLRLARHWSFGGRTWRLERGRYQWYVWPAFGTRTSPRYGQPLGASSFVVR